MIRRILGAALCLTCHWVFALEPIVIGQSLGLSPPDRESQEVLAGTAAYVEAVNARGGIAGRPLRLITMDDGNVPARHQQNLRTLVNVERAVAIINCVGADICLASAVTAGELRTPLVGIQNGSKLVSRQNGPYVFRIRPTWDQEADRLMKQLQSLGITKTALVTEQRSETESAKALFTAATQHKITLGSVLLAAATSVGFNQLMASLGNGGYQAAVIELQPSTIIALREAGVDARPEWPTVLMTMSSVSLAHIRTGFPKRLIGFTALVPNPENPTAALTTELQKNSVASPSGGGLLAMTHTGLESYISLKVVGEAIRRSGKQVDAARIAKALEGMSGFDLGGYNVSFTNGKPSASEFVDMAFRTRDGTLR